MKNFSWPFFILLGLVFVFFSSIVALFTDWWWFSEVEFTEIFIKSLTMKLAVGLAAGLFSAVFLIGNFLTAARSKVPWMSAIPESFFGQQIIIYGKAVRIVGSVLCLVISFFIGLVASNAWLDVLKFLNATPFGQTDPLFGRDVSLYVFSLPLLSLGLGFLKALTLLSIIGCGIVYILQGKLLLSSFFGKGFYTLSEKLSGKLRASAFRETDQKARMHIGLLLSIFLLTIAGGTYLSMYGLLTVQSGPVFGAAFTDANVMIPLLKVAVFVYGLAAFLALFYGVSGRISPLLGAIILSGLIGLSTGIIPQAFQKFVVAPNELTKETPFIKHTIEATRKAYGLADIEKRQISADKSLTSEDIAANNLTVKNVRLWDRAPLLSTFSQIQEIRTYYEFASVDNDRYIINDEIRQVMLSPRELAADSLPNRNWINEHLTFTHGYGIAAGPVNQVTPEGLPVLFVKDLPPKSDKKELAITQPEIYYGELVNEYVIVKTKSKEFGYPKGEDNVYTTYSGKGGVEINSPLKKLFYALQFNSLKMFLSGDINPDSRIMYHRDIKERVQKIAPFLSYDGDPYMVVADGKLYWILDAYTLSQRYPYSQQTSLNGRTVNYIRNSVKVTVDAYNGTVMFYQADEKDPIVNTYAKIFPKTFRKLSDMPKSLVSHLRYPEEIFTLQTEIYTTYHMDDPQIFYNKEDQWEVPAIAQGATGQAEDATSMEPRHMIMKLPGEKKEEFILMLPFTPRSKDNLSAWMVARNDNGNYGKLVVYRFPKDKLIFGPKQIMGRINQDAEISRQISLWDQRGSQVIQGPLMVIPIEESLLYVRPLYLKADTGKIPELKRVIVAYENKIAMEETLEKGLARIFGGYQTAPSSSDQPQEKQATSAAKAKSSAADSSKDELSRQAAEAYDAALDAQKSGDWAKYGEEIKKLGEILEKL